MFSFKRQATALAIATSALLLVASSPEISFATPKPTQAQIDAAKAAEALKAKAAASAQNKLASATQTLRQLTAIADAAAAKYRKAQADLVVATQQANTAAAHYALAQIGRAHV